MNVKYIYVMYVYIYIYNVCIYIYIFIYLFIFIQCMYIHIYVITDGPCQYKNDPNYRVYSVWQQRKAISSLGACMATCGNYS